MTDEWVCPICLEGEVINGEEIPCHNLQPCGHRFHTNCIVEALRRNGPNCPMCRGIQEEEVNNNINQDFDNIINFNQVPSVRLLINLLVEIENNNISRVNMANYIRNQIRDRII